MAVTASHFRPPLTPLRVRAPRQANLHVDVGRVGHAPAHDLTPLYSPCASPFAPDLSVPEVGSLPSPSDFFSFLQFCDLIHM